MQPLIGVCIARDRPDSIEYDPIPRKRLSKREIQMTKRLLILVMALILVPAATALAQTDTKTPAKQSHKKHHARKKHRSVGGEYKKGGSDVGNGSKKLAHNVKHGRVV